jgi:hypothetical protein
MPNQNHLQSRDGGTTSSNFKTQRQHILDLLMAADGGEVPLADIMVCAAQYNFCIHALRKRGYKIINRTETRNGVKHSWYRLESSPESPSLSKSSSATPAPRSSQRKSVHAEPAAPPPTAPPQTLSLFPDMAVPSSAPQHPVWRDPELGGVKNGGMKHG